MTCVKELELGDGILEGSALNVVHTRIGRPANYIIGKGENPIYDHDPQDGLADEFKKVRDTRACFTSRSIPAGHASEGMMVKAKQSNGRSSC